jgi:hypothetical protein
MWLIIKISLIIIRSTKTLIRINNITYFFNNNTIYAKYNIKNQ